MELGARPGVRVPLLVFLGFRLALFVYMPIARQVHPGPFELDEYRRPYLGVFPTENPLLEPWQRWDTLHYQALAERGYVQSGTGVFAPPLYPMLVRVAASFMGGDTLVAGLVVSNLAYLLGLFYLYRLVAMETSDDTARCTLLYLASFPTAFFFLGAYTESLLLVSSVAALYHARRSEWLLAGLWGFVASVSRLQGGVLVVALAYQAWEQRRGGKPKTWWPLVALAATGLGALVFPLYVWQVLGESPLEIFATQSARFHGAYVVPGVDMVKAMGALWRGELVLADYFDLAFCLLFIGLTIQAFRRLPRVYGIYGGATLFLLLAKTADIQPLLSFSRYVLSLFPAFIVLGQLGANRWVHRAILYPSWFGLLYLSGQFAIWGWVG
jgi:hypothetical protein